MRLSFGDKIQTLKKLSVDVENGIEGAGVDALTQFMVSLGMLMFYCGIMEAMHRDDDEALVIIRGVVRKTMASIREKEA